MPGGVVDLGDRVDRALSGVRVKLTEGVGVERLLGVPLLVLRVTRGAGRDRSFGLKWTRSRGIVEGGGEAVRIKGKGCQKWKRLKWLGRKETNACDVWTALERR